MANTFVKIASVTVGSGGAASMSFSSIPSTYTDLCVKISARTNRASIADAILASLNGSSSSFTWTLLEGDGVSAYSATGSTGLVGVANAATSTANTFSNCEFYVPNYAGSTNKSISVDSVIERNAGADTYADLAAVLWSNTSAINSITLTPSFGSFVQYSTATLYGVISPAVGAKATGGIISTDGAYFYHTFTASGTFTPTQSLSCDVLVVAGGGGGGYFANGGGGGAGGLLYGSLSVTATGYAVTVGAGGTTPYPGSGAGGDGSNSSFTSSYVGQGGGGGGGQGAVNGRPGGSGGGAATGGSAGSGQQTTQSPLTGFGNIGGAGAGNCGGGGAGGAAAGQTPGIGKAYYGTTYATGGQGTSGPESPGRVNSGDGAPQGSSGGSGVVIVRYAV